MSDEKYFEKKYLALKSQIEIEGCEAGHRYEAGYHCSIPFCNLCKLRIKKEYLEKQIKEIKQLSDNHDGSNSEELLSWIDIIINKSIKEIEEWQ